MKKVFGLFLMALFFLVNVQYVDAVTLDASDLVIDGKTCYKNYHNTVTNEDKHGTLPSIFITVDSKPGYCVNFKTELNKGEADYQESYLTKLNNNKKLYNKISLIGLYGYSYSSHKTNNYYGAAQLLIWEEILGAGLQPGYNVIDLNFYSSNAGYHAGELINLEKEKTEILKLVADYYKKPSFCDKSYTIKEGESLSLTDSNNVLSNYKVTRTGNYVDYQVIDNKIHLDGTKAGEGSTITFSKGLDDTLTMVYSVNNGQEVIFPTDYPDVSCQINVDVIEEEIPEEGYIQIKKVDKDTDEPLEGVKFSIYNSNNEIVETVVTDKDGIALSQKLPYGKYYILEVESLDGYILNEKKIDVKVDANDVFEIELTNEKEVPEQVPTGDILIGVVWAIGLFCLGLGIHYYTEFRKKES